MAREFSETSINFSEKGVLHNKALFDAFFQQEGKMNT